MRLISQIIGASVSLGADKDYKSDVKKNQAALNKQVGARVGDGFGSAGANFNIGSSNYYTQDVVTSGIVGSNLNVNEETSKKHFGSIFRDVSSDFLF